MDVTLQEAKAQLSCLLRRVEGGESVTIWRGCDPVATLVKAPARPKRRRIWDDLDGTIGADFDDLPDGFESGA